MHQWCSVRTPLLKAWAPCGDEFFYTCLDLVGPFEVTSLFFLMHHYVWILYKVCNITSILCVYTSFVFICPVCIICRLLLAGWYYNHIMNLVVRIFVWITIVRIFIWITIRKVAL